MEVFKYPQKEDWSELLKRPVMDLENLKQKVNHIIVNVKTLGDQTLIEFAKHYDKAELESLEVSEEEWESASSKVSLRLKEAIETARSNIEKFHRSQKPIETMIETTPGVWCWRKAVPIEKVGLYIPGGTAPLLSTFLMLGVPAQIAGCKEIVVCTPPNREGKVDPTILYIAKILGIQKVYKAGGAQAIAAMAYGTETIPAVHKIFGPGNRYVTMAKQLVSLDGVGIDLPAGPSEVAVIADRTANPKFIATDLLSQAEHGADSQVLLVLTDEGLIDQVQEAIEQQLQTLPRARTARQALDNSKIFLVKDTQEAIELSNAYAPEHLIIITENGDALAEKVINAGSVFIGPWTPEAAGDYASGPNHTLPTNGYAFSYSGVSLESFIKVISFQKISEAGLRQLGRTIMELAQAEGLEAHKRAVSIRLETMFAMNSTATKEKEANNG
ncbi:MAG: histidinol dehydrogenase [Calditrichaeota bacterium]|nr:histidinol dehydrogenase [Calditrichota bacterium]